MSSAEPHSVSPSASSSIPSGSCREPPWNVSSTSPTRVEVARGQFTHVNASDPIHWGKGSTTLYREGAADAVVFLNEDFEVGPGPRFHVYLVDNLNVRSGADFQASRQIDLGRLHAFKGSQIYFVPKGTSLADYKSVVIWCKEFGVLISPASLAAAAGKGPRVSLGSPASSRQD